jgi:hypothetical protein
VGTAGGEGEGGEGEEEALHGEGVSSGRVGPANPKRDVVLVLVLVLVVVVVVVVDLDVDVDVDVDHSAI